MRIVLIMTEPPLPFGNAAARWYYVLFHGLVERGHTVSAFAVCRNQQDMEAAHHLFPAPQYSLRCYQYNHVRSHRTRITALYRPHAYLFSAALVRDMEAELRRGFDILHLEQLWGGWVGLPYRDRTLLNVHFLFQIDRAGERPSSLLERARMIRTVQAENHLLRQYPFLCTLSPRMSAHVGTVNRSAEVHTVPLGFDISRYPFEPSGQAGAPVVSLIGSFDWRPSYSAGKRLLDHLWPAIRKRVPEAQLQIAGRRALAVLGEYANLPGVSIHQDVPDTLPYFRQGSVMLYAPERGSGMKVKVLEAFALGLPVVTNEDGVEGIPALDGVHAGVSNDDAGLVDRTVQLLQNPPAGERQARAARALVERHCNPGVTLDAIEKLYARILERKRAGAA